MHYNYSEKKKPRMSRVRSMSQLAQLLTVLPPMPITSGCVTSVPKSSCNWWEKPATEPDRNRFGPNRGCWF